VSNGSEIVGGVGGHQGIVELPGQFEHFAEARRPLPGGPARRRSRPRRFMARIRPSVSARERNRWKADSAKAIPAPNSHEPGGSGGGQQLGLGPMADRRVRRGLMLLRASRKRPSPPARGAGG
jgi:hypothetical protein